MKLSESTNRVIDLGRKVREYYDAELPKRYPNYPLVGAEDVTAPPPPEEKEMSDFLATLPEDMIYQLRLIMLLGRGEFGTDDLAAYYEDFKGTYGDPEHVASQMMSDKAIIAGELSDGLVELRKHEISLDKLPLKKVKVRKR